MEPRGERYVQMLKDAVRGGYAVGSFNVDSLDVLGLLVGRVVETHSPAIFQFGPWSFSHLPIQETAAAARGVADAAPCCFIHLDHGRDLDVLERCVEAGFDSVMFDGSDLPPGENIARTREAVRAGHAAGAAVEGALGRLERGVDTDPLEARAFVSETDVDALAVAVGTGHGQQRAPEQIDLERLNALSEPGVPLVIHGGSGLPAEVMGAVRSSAVAKVNVATACYRNAEAAVERLVQEKGCTGHVSAVARAAADGYWEVMHRRLELLGSLGKEAQS